MDKRELVELTIERLLANFDKSPESFDLKMPDSSHCSPTIYWKPKIKIDNYDIADDPNNNHAVVVTYNSSFSELRCYIFLKAPATAYEYTKADHSVSISGYFIKLTSSYRKYKKLIRLIQTRDLHQDNMNYLSKLSSVFPDALDKHILKD